MITIISINRLHEMYRNEYNRQWKFEPIQKQIEYILSVDSINGTIHTLPHDYGILYDYFIKDHLDNNGYIIQGRYETLLYSKKITYNLIYKLK